MHAVLCVVEVRSHKKLDLVKQAPRQYRKRPLAVREVSADLQKMREIELKKDRDLLM